MRAASGFALPPRLPLTDPAWRLLPRSDCWEANDPGRDTSGQLEPNPERFPAGMKALGDHMHSLGVSFGIYSDEGTRTCGGFQGSEGHEATDAKTFASWVRQPGGGQLDGVVRCRYHLRLSRRI